MGDPFVSGFSDLFIPGIDFSDAPATLLHQTPTTLQIFSDSLTPVNGLLSDFLFSDNVPIGGPVKLKLWFPCRQVGWASEMETEFMHLGSMLVSANEDFFQELRLRVKGLKYVQRTASFHAFLLSYSLVLVKSSLPHSTHGSCRVDEIADNDAANAGLCWRSGIWYGQHKALYDAWCVFLFDVCTILDVGQWRVRSVPGITFDSKQNVWYGLLKKETSNRSFWLHMMSILCVSLRKYVTPLFYCLRFGPKSWPGRSHCLALSEFEICLDLFSFFWVTFQLSFSSSFLFSPILFSYPFPKVLNLQSYFFCADIHSALF